MSGEQIELTKEKIAEYKEAFSFFDKNGIGQIDLQDLPMLLRSINMNPTNSEIETIKREIDSDNTGKAEFPDFLAAVAKRDFPIDHEQELIDAFKTLHKGSVINSQLLKKYMTSDEDAFSSDELQLFSQILGLTEEPSEVKLSSVIEFIMASLELNSQK